MFAFLWLLLAVPGLGAAGYRPAPDSFWGGGHRGAQCGGGAEGVAGSPCMRPPPCAREKLGRSRTSYGSWVRPVVLTVCTQEAIVGTGSYELRWHFMGMVPGELTKYVESRAECGVCMSVWA